MATATRTRKAPAGKGEGRGAAKRKAQLAKMRARSGNRWRVHYDIEGPRVRLGLLWFVGAMVALALGVVGAAAYFGLAFAAAAAHTARTWRARGLAVEPRVALLGVVVVVAAAAVGPQVMGIALLLVTAATVIWATVGPSPIGPLAGTGAVLQAALPTAVAGGCLVLLADREVWAVIALVLLASAYETGDFLIGSGSANAVEGPVAGAAAVLVMSLVVAAAGVPPFGVGDAMVLGVVVAPLAFLGQLLASAMLPHSRAFAPALRRVDSLLLAAPVWYVAVTRAVL